MQKKPKMSDIANDFDAKFYLDSNSDVAKAGVDPLRHFWDHGWKEGRNPNRIFNTSLYLLKHPELKSKGLNPFWHFIVDQSSMDMALTTPKMDEIESKFSAEYYLANNPDVAAANIDPLEHFWYTGWKEGRNPSADFNTAEYINNNPKVVETNTNPLWHFLFEKGEKISSKMSKDKVKRDELIQNKKTELSTQQEISDEFDANFYLGKYRDVLDSGLDPLQHYCDTGWREGRDPNSKFSTSFYLQANDDVADAGVNPFWHYVKFGKAEGRTPRHPGGSVIERLNAMKPLSNWKQPNTNPNEKDGQITISELRKYLFRPKWNLNEGLAVSVSHDNYLENSGGVQFCIDQEESKYRQRNWTYLQFSPVQKLPILSSPVLDPNYQIEVVVNGKLIGKCPITTLINCLKGMREEIPDIQVVIHHAMGHVHRRLIELIESAGRSECFLWLHDYFTICPSFTLSRNLVEYCNAPELTSNACQLCYFGEVRAIHLAWIRELFVSVKVHLISPSEVAYQIWSGRTYLKPASVNIIPHMSLEWKNKERTEKTESRCITVGFVGTPALHKGWDVFEQLVEQYQSSGDYRFVFFGIAPITNAGIDRVPIRVSAKDPDAMITAIANECCDLVLHWASWPETFSFSTYEALSAGAFVLTNTISGNVAATIRRTGCGMIFESKDELLAFFDSEDLGVLVDDVRRKRSTSEVNYSFSDLSLELSQFSIERIQAR